MCRLQQTKAITIKKTEQNKPKHYHHYHHDHLPLGILALGSHGIIAGSLRNLGSSQVKFAKFAEQ